MLFLHAINYGNLYSIKFKNVYNKKFLIGKPLSRNNKIKAYLFIMNKGVYKFLNNMYRLSRNS